MDRRSDRGGIFAPDPSTEAILARGMRKTPVKHDGDSEMNWNTPDQIRITHASGHIVGTDFGNCGIHRCPDGPRYRAVGNSMTVDVMRWLGQRINVATKLE